MSLRARLQDPLPVTAPLVLNPLMARMVEAAGFSAGYLGGGATGYQKVALEANLNLTEMCQAAIDIRAVSSLPLILDGACGYGDPMHMHRTVGMAEAAGFAAIEIEDQLVPKRAHHHVGIEHMIPVELMAAKVKESVAARRSHDFLIIGRTNAMRASTLEAPMLVASISSEPAVLIVAPITGSPRCFSTGIDSPVSIDSSTAELPWTTTPSIAMRSPGRTITRSPLRTSAIATSRSWPPRRTRAVDGWSFASWRNARVVFRLARASMAWPSSTSAMMMITAS